MNGTWAEYRSGEGTCHIQCTEIQQQIDDVVIQNDEPVERARDIVVNSYGPIFLSTDITYGDTTYGETTQLEFVRRHKRLGEVVNCHFRAKASDINVGKTIINSNVNDKLTITIEKAFLRTAAIGLTQKINNWYIVYFGCKKFKSCPHIQKQVIISNQYKLYFNYWHHFPGLGMGERKIHIACFQGVDLKRAIMFDTEEVDFENRISVTYLDSRSTVQQLENGKIELRDACCATDFCELCQVEEEERERERQARAELKRKRAREAEERAREAEERARQAEEEKKRARQAEEEEKRAQVRNIMKKMKLTKLHTGWFSFHDINEGDDRDFVDQVQKG
jgi:hypothetical protein